MSDDEQPSSAPPPFTALTTDDPTTFDDDDQDGGVDDPATHSSGDADDDIVVLGWWQRPLNIVTLLVTTALVAGMVGWLIHDTTSEPNASDVDVGFLWDMRVHHEQAVQMGFIYLELPDTDPGLRTIAAEIVMGQSSEIGRMVQLLRGYGEEEARDSDDPTMGWMGMVSAPAAQPGMATAEQVEELQRSEGRDADELFVELMTTHHQGGIDMASYAAEHADDGEVVAMAEGMVVGQRGEIIEMEQRVDDAG